MQQSQFYLFQLYSYSLDCGFKPIGSFGCDRFWGMLFIILILICALVFIKAALYLYKDYQDYRRYLNKLIERAKIADVDIMDSVKWNPDNNLDHLSYDEIAEKFREKLNQK